MLLKDQLELLHLTQSIRVYLHGDLVTTGKINRIKDESYLNNKVKYIFSEDMDSISIEIYQV